MYAGYESMNVVFSQSISKEMQRKNQEDREQGQVAATRCSDTSKDTLEKRCNNSIAVVPPAGWGA